MKPYMHESDTMTFTTSLESSEKQSLVTFWTLSGCPLDFLHDSVLKSTQEYFRGCFNIFVDINLRCEINGWPMKRSQRPRNYSYVRFSIKLCRKSSGHPKSVQKVSKQHFFRCYGTRSNRLLNLSLNNFSTPLTWPCQVHEVLT